MIKHIILFQFRDPEECIPTVMEKLHSNKHSTNAKPKILFFIALPPCFIHHILTR